MEKKGLYSKSQTLSSYDKIGNFRTFDRRSAYRKGNLET